MWSSIHKKMSPLSHLPPQPPHTPFLQPPAPLLFFFSPSLSYSFMRARTRAFVHTHSMTANGRGRSPPAQRAPQLRGAHILALMGARAARSRHFSKQQQQTVQRPPSRSLNPLLTSHEYVCFGLANRGSNKYLDQFHSAAAVQSPSQRE